MGLAVQKGKKPPWQIYMLNVEKFSFLNQFFSCEIDTGTSIVCGAYLLIYVDYWGGRWEKKVYIPHLGDPTTSLNICPCT